MCKIVIIGVGHAGRNVLKKLKDGGLEDAEMMSFGAFLEDDDREDIPHHNLITMNGNCGMSPGEPPEFWRGYTENVSDQIEEIIEQAFKND